MSNLKSQNYNIEKINKYLYKQNPQLFVEILNFSVFSLVEKSF